MFSSEQIFEISGDMGQLEKAIKFAISMFGSKCESYQISEDGKYCLGWMVKDGWKPFPFDFDAHIISKSRITAKVPMIISMVARRKGFS